MPGSKNQKLVLLSGSCLQRSNRNYFWMKSSPELLKHLSGLEQPVSSQRQPHFCRQNEGELKSERLCNESAGRCTHAYYSNICYRENKKEVCFHSLGVLAC